ncbi:TonB-dependent receptor [uncultured Hyphomicrobium sp.]|uniref:TonB-dependent receptor family protein n=1 Tax=uncultured Hyphomicrobium sp. TaxID=194373 RepID=UPI0025F726EC|nr:TonB-dependent receptor [uncultured Hyphomicrobium sp.]
MSGRKYLRISVVAGAVGLLAAPAGAQTAAEPAEGALPEIEVIQKKTPLASGGTRKRAPAAKAASPTTEAAPVSAPETLDNSPYGASASGPASERAENGPLAPTNAKALVPGDLQNAQGGASRITSEQIDDFRPATVHESLVRVPGVTTISDDGFGRHSGIGIRGAAPRRSRKVLVMEDGVPINFSTYLDSSNHYTPPIERVESIEVFRGPIVNYGPLNNHGVINFRNLSPFGANETVIKAGIGTTEGSDMDVNNFRHVHTRQNLGNVGVVASYSGADAGGSWDVEELGYNDFYGALGFRGSKQDLTISGGYFRQRDTYDEDNIDDQDDFFRYRRSKTAAALAGAMNEAQCCHNLSSYNADYFRFQLAHNLYIDDNTTISTRLFGNDHERARFYPNENAAVGALEMEGRDRHYRNYGADSRVEFANLTTFGLKHDVQIGVRYEEHRFNNQNRIGDLNQVLTWGTRGAPAEPPQKLEADAFAAFAQTAIHLTPRLTVTPGVRFENYEISYRDLGDPDAAGDASYDHVLPMISFSWETMPRTTIYGGYHRGLTPHIVRDAINDLDVFEAPPEEIGDNFELGVRSTAIRGVTLDTGVFHKRIENYQYGEAFQEAGGDRVFSTLGEVTLTGFEIYGRLDSQPFTRGPWNFFGEATYTYIDAEIERGVDTPDDGVTFVNVAGNRVPESFEHFAHLTLGTSYRDLWDASVSWTYRGDYHTNGLNSSFADEGLVPDVWLLSARSNFKLTDDLTLWATGHNLTDEFYISERSDGIKPGVGRTVMGGFTLKFD